MPANDTKNLLVILDNLDEFSGKMLTQIANETMEGRQQLLNAIIQANEKYNKPIETHVTGWFYYFSRTRGPVIQKAIDNIEIEADPIKRLELFKNLLIEGQWNVGSFNYHLFLELINGVPGYEALDDESAMPVIKRLDRLLLNKMDGFIREFKVNQRLIAEREQSRLALQKTHDGVLDNIVLEGSLLSAQHAATVPYKKIAFHLIKGDQWKLFWVDPNGTSYALNLSQELETYLIKQGIEHIEKLNPESIKRVKKECLKIRDAFFEKTQVQINPKQAKTGEELSNEQLCTQGLTSAFVVRGKAGKFSIDWINTLGKAMPIDLEGYPELSEFLASQEDFIAEDLVQLKAHLLQVKTANALGMGDFKIKLQNCLLNRTPPKLVEASQVKRLDLSSFKELEHCLAQRGKQLPVVDANASVEELAEPEEPQVQKLNFSKYSAVATLFAHRANQPAKAQWLDDTPPMIIENHL
ncbi:hypothetical protein [Legionella sp. km772]|uniref:hypothetical protein n=1 Tax=Legionella sp. km772 TaxID=2498111 RepID=UPI000F8D9EE7|nr:hypothetical protein [Legionella sp. km772]RUR09002.1 hypothetical protein ELY15_09790 [Legionella sp. km772]